MDALLPADSAAALRHGRSWNQASLKARLATALQRKYGNDLSVLPNLTLSVNGQPMTPDLSLFMGTTDLAKPDIALVAELPLIAIVILSSSQALDAQVKMSQNYLLAGVRSCWLIEPTLRAVFVTGSLGVYETFNNNEMLCDPATGIELELGLLFG